MDVCVVLYRCDASRVTPGLRAHDRLTTVDNTVRNLGFAAGANAAAAQGEDHLICFVNPDGDLTSACLDELERAMVEPTVVACEPDLGPMNRRPLPNGEMEWLSGACLVVRRSAFEQVGGFDPQLFMYGEDVDLSYKLARLGRLIHVSGARFSHDSGERSFVALHRNFRNHLVVQRRHRTADPARMLRDAIYAFRRHQWKIFAARTTGTADYLIRARRWATTTQPPLGGQ
jgi:GT2 family glycosyltransferase